MKNRFGIDQPRPILIMALDALHAMPDAEALDAIMVRLGKMPHGTLEQFANEIGREAWAKARLDARPLMERAKADGELLPAPPAAGRLK